MRHFLLPELCEYALLPDYPGNEEVPALTQLGHGGFLRQCVQIAAAVQRELLALSVRLMLPGACCHCVTCHGRKEKRET